MVLLERYLSAVGRHLPAAQKEDILAELRDDIQAGLDERAAQVGRPLTLDEEAEFLEPYGRPVLMAGRYARRKHLVGPGWFPFYWTTLKITLALVLTVQVALVVLSAIIGRPDGYSPDKLIAFPFQTAVAVFAWVTLVFAALETVTPSGKFADGWDPRKLPPPKPAGVPRPSRFEIAFELVISAAFVTWWVALRDSWGVAGLPPGLALSPAWSAFYLPVLLVVLASMLEKCVVLVRPDWTGFRLAGNVALTAVGVLIAAWVLSAGPLFLAADAGQAERLARLLNSLLRVSIAIGVLISVATTAAHVWRWARSRSRQPVGP